MRCANCLKWLSDHETTGDSGLYNHGDGINYTLCELCFFAEEALVESEGKNDLPEVRKRYELNQPGGAR